jgi:hypothetical protein
MAYFLHLEDVVCSYVAATAELADTLQETVAGEESLN